MAELPPIDMPFAHGGPLCAAQLRALADDFVVSETLPFELTGSGEHLYVQLRKTNANTTWVAEQIGRICQIPQRDIGFAGMKDRRAVATQWFSVYLPGRDVDPTTWVIEGVEVLHAARHSGKLRRGAVGHNTFAIRLRDVSMSAADLSERLARIGAHGVPNYFGEQRFGRSGDNVEQALVMFAGRRVARTERGILLSAARSALFNVVLAERVRAGSWGHILPGEVVALDGSHSVFGPVMPDDELSERLARLDIHPSGPLWGEGRLRTTLDARALEAPLAERYPEITQGLEKAGLEQDRRALRLCPLQLVAEWEKDSVMLRLRLGAGQYATTVLREIVSWENSSAVTNAANFVA